MVKYTALEIQSTMIFMLAQLANRFLNEWQNTGDIVSYITARASACEQSLKKKNGRWIRNTIQRVMYTVSGHKIPFPEMSCP